MMEALNSDANSRPSTHAQDTRNVEFCFAALRHIHPTSARTPEKAASTELENRDLRRSDASRTLSPPSTSFGAIRAKAVLCNAPSQ